MITAAVLTISDSCSAGTREDVSGPALRARCEELGWTVASHAVIPDDYAAITQLLHEWADSEDVKLVLTTGGTGPAPRDITPEATRAVIERELPGLAELIRAEGRKRTKYSALSRGLAGSRGQTLIVNLPGSPRGAIESLDTIADLVPHILDLLAGRTEH
jgi:molybdopterin adenylyltransferase